MIFAPDGNLGYEGLNSFLCFCRYCSVDDFVGPTSCSDTLHTNGSVEGGICGNNNYRCSGMAREYCVMPVIIRQGSFFSANMKLFYLVWMTGFRTNSILIACVAVLHATVMLPCTRDGH